jgi:hypothetical protein
MTWDDIDEILQDGTAEQIATVRCQCGGNISYRYTRFEDDDSGAFTIRCDRCRLMSLGRLGPGHLTPPCVEYFGPEATIDKNLRMKESA